MKTLVEGGFALILILVISVYMLLYGDRIGRLVRTAMPPGDGTPEDDYPIRVQKAVSGYVRGQLAFSLIMGTSAGICLWILGAVGVFPDGKTYALFFGGFYGLMELVPYLGPILGALPAILVALFQDPLTGLWVALLFVALQQLEGHVVAPQVFGHSLRINPLLVIFALLIGAQLYGIVGAFVALPLAAVARETVVYLRRHLILEPWGTPSATEIMAGRDAPRPLLEPAYCPDCGAVQDEDDTFCRKCGAALEQPAAGPASLLAMSAPPTAAPVALGAEGLTKRFGDRVALRDVSFSAAPGELVAIIGPNGAGKTTLLSILAGIQRPDGGRASRAPADIGWVPQQPALYSKLSVAENLRLFARLERVADPEAAVRAMLAQTGLEDRADEEVAKLSGGNRQRVNVAIGLLADPPVLLLDEPTTALDPSQRERLWEFIGGLAEGGTTVVYSTHNVQEADRYADRVLVLADGELIFTGSPRALETAVGAEGIDFEGAFVRFLRDQGH